MDAFELVMRQNLFEFGDVIALQRIGTAMGTSCAVVLANLYSGWHEKTTLLPKYKRPMLILPATLEDSLKPMPILKRFIDDIIGAWDGSLAEFEEFKADLNDFGILQWDVSELSAIRLTSLT